MNLRTFLRRTQETGDLIRIRREVDLRYEMARLIAALDGRPLLFENVLGSPYRVVAGLCSDRRYFALALDIQPDQVLHRLVEAMEHPVPPPVVSAAPCQEVVEEAVDLMRIPFLTHWPGDAGDYATTSVAIVDDPETGPNASYHRLLRLDARRCAARIVEQRGTDTARDKVDADLPVAFCIGLPLHVLLAAAMAPPPGVDELAIANALAPTPVVPCRSVPLHVPAEAEFVLEGRITRRQVKEGPFVDLTGTWDKVREQPVVEIDCITHRRDALYQALVPGLLEHKMLMGMPREPTMFSAIQRVCRCLNIYITPGGASWLHAVVQIEKRAPDDGQKAIAAAFEGHGSLKHLVVVDDDVDPFDLRQVEWAIATRFQAGRDLILLPNQPGSSLDPSGEHKPGQKARSDKMALDATIPWDTPTGPSNPDAFRRVPLEPIDVEPYLEPFPPSGVSHCGGEQDVG